MVNLMEEFTNRNIQVDLYLMKKGGAFQDFIPKGVRVFIKEGSYYSRIKGFIDYLNKEKPDCSLSARHRQDMGNIMGCLLSNSGTIPIISIHTNLTTEQSFSKKSIKHIIFNRFKRKMYEYPNKFIAVSHGVAYDFAVRNNISLADIKIIHNPIHKPYNEKSISSDELEKLNTILPSKSFIIAVGRLTEAKDFATLIKAFKKVRKKNDLSLLILGEGKLRKELLNLINELGLENDVFLPGFVKYPQFFIKRASLLVMSSKWEGFGNVIVEALGVGTPVVSTDCPSGPREILENGKYGKLVPVGNYSLMAEAINTSINLKHDHELLINRAKDFQTDKIAKEYIDYIFITHTHTDHINWLWELNYRKNISVFHPNDSLNIKNMNYFNYLEWEWVIKKKSI